MTAIYAFASKSNKLAFIASDNIEIKSRKKVDKVFLLEGHFYVGVLGPDVAVEAIDAMKKFEDYPNFTPLDSAQTIMEKIGEYTKVLCNYHYRKHLEDSKFNKTTQRDWDEILKNDLKIVVLDFLKYDLYKADFGYPFPPEKLLDKPEIKKLTDGILHLFGFAKDVAKSSQENIDIRSIKDDPYSFVQERINQDKLRVQQIGDLGASIIVKEGKSEFLSCFSDPLEYIEETCSRITGLPIKYD